MTSRHQAFPLTKLFFLFYTRFIKIRSYDKRNDVTGKEGEYVCIISGVNINATLYKTSRGRS